MSAEDPCANCAHDRELHDPVCHCGCKRYVPKQSDDARKLADAELATIQRYERVPSYSQVQLLVQEVHRLRAIVARDVEVRRAALAEAAKVADRRIADATADILIHQRSGNVNGEHLQWGKRITAEDIAKAIRALLSGASPAPGSQGGKESKSAATAFFGAAADALPANAPSVMAVPSIPASPRTVETPTPDCGCVPGDCAKDDGAVLANVHCRMYGSMPSAAPTREAACSCDKPTIMGTGQCGRCQGRTFWEDPAVPVGAPKGEAPATHVCGGCDGAGCDAGGAACVVCAGAGRVPNIGATPPRREAATFSELVYRVGHLPTTGLASGEAPKAKCGTCEAFGNPQCAHGTGDAP